MRSSDRGSRPSWVTWFPVKDKLLDGRRDSQSPLLVDIGGGRGHDLMEFVAQFPDEPGRFVLQDQQPVLDSITSLSPKIEKKRVIDFFRESPVAGARVYFIKFVLHDFPDKDCAQILNNVRASMSKGHSYLVINDFILPDTTGCPHISAEWDLMKLALASEMERTETQWRALLSSAGFAIEGMYQPPGDGQGIIVATLQYTRNVSGI
ncbi:S-adenosyl-L-methionine-dependent methyltransferase [Biscogniauxia mediterranea]|nr:S-adenosyl-L-methionine-dependent methyltransferase [Biscogniauxia mediterranea]